MQSLEEWNAEAAGVAGLNRKGIVNEFYQ